MKMFTRASAGLAFGFSVAGILESWPSSVVVGLVIFGVMNALHSIDISIRERSK